MEHPDFPQDPFSDLSIMSIIFDIQRHQIPF